MDLSVLVETISYVGIFGILFAETGLLVGFLLPGDTLLITVGLLAAAHKLALLPALLALLLGSFLGNHLGYFWGWRLGPALEGWASRRVPEGSLAKTRSYLRRYGAWGLLFGPLVPVVRTLIPFLSGAAVFPLPRFSLLTLLGGALWTQGVTLLTYRVGRAIPHLDRYVVLILLVGVLSAALPGLWGALRHRRLRED